MGTLKIPNTFGDGNTIQAVDFNANNSAITAVINGDIDANNIEDSSITAAKISGQLAKSSVNSGVCMFAAYLSTDQAVVENVTVKVKMDTEDFDIGGVFDNLESAGEGYRFLPTIAGYYKVTWGVVADKNAASSYLLASVWKNGVAHAGEGNHTPTPNDAADACGAIIIQMNGSTDYLEVFVWSRYANTLPGANRTVHFSAHLVATT